MFAAHTSPSLLTYRPADLRYVVRWTEPETLERVTGPALPFAKAERMAHDIRRFGGLSVAMVTVR